MTTSPPESDRASASPAPSCSGGNGGGAPAAAAWPVALTKKRKKTRQTNENLTNFFFQTSTPFFFFHQRIHFVLDASPLAWSHSWFFFCSFPSFGKKERKREREREREGRDGGKKREKTFLLLPLFLVLSSRPRHFLPCTPLCLEILLVTGPPPPFLLFFGLCSEHPYSPVLSTPPTHYHSCLFSTLKSRVFFSSAVFFFFRKPQKTGEKKRKKTFSIRNPSHLPATNTSAPRLLPTPRKQKRYALLSYPQLHPFRSSVIPPSVFAHTQKKLDH